MGGAFFELLKLLARWWFRRYTEATNDDRGKFMFRMDPGPRVRAGDDDVSV